MANYTAIAGVTNSLKALLRDRMTETPVEITTAPPDVKVDSITGRRVNLYLYHLTENQYLKNQEIPGEGYLGAYGNPPLSLILRYIFTAFGTSDTGQQADIEAQRILGDAMRVLHDTGIITPDLVEEKQPSPKPRILDSSLLGEFEQVKITFQPASLEEISKIWTALPNVNFRRSVLYEVSVVQVQSQKPRSIALPVKLHRVYSLPARTPWIQQIFQNPPAVPNQLIAAGEEGETLRLLGSNFKSATTHVNMDGFNAIITSLKDDQLDVVIPTGVFFAGLHSLQVEQDVMLKEAKTLPAVQRTAFGSNSVAFMLLPKSGAITPATATAGDTITVAVTPAVKPMQEKVLLLGDNAITALPLAFDSGPSNSVQFQLPTDPQKLIAPGTYPVRLRIDGAESRLTFDITTRLYTGPMYTVT